MDREVKLDMVEIGRGYIGAILLAVLMQMGVVTAIYAGECMEIDLGELENCEDVIYMVIGNSSNLDGMDISLNTEEKNVSVCFEVNYKPDNFTLVFFNSQTHEIEKIIYKDGDGGSVRYSDRDIVQDQVAYVLEHINDTEVVGVVGDTDGIDTIDDAVVPEENTYRVWYILLAIAVGGALCWYAVKKLRRRRCGGDDLDLLKNMGAESVPNHNQNGER